MEKYYKSKFYKENIEVANIEDEIILTIKTDSGKEIIYSWYDLEEKNTRSDYINNCLLGSFIKDIPNNYLVLGVGGGSFIKYLEDNLIEERKITGVEIDKTMLEIAKNDYKIKTRDLYNLDVNNALDILINKKNKFDYIFIDLYGSDGNIPKSISDKSFFEKIFKLKSKGGLIGFNFADYFGERKSYYDDIHNNLIDQFGINFIHFLSGENGNGNISGIYGLEKKYNNEEIIFSYLEKVQNGELNYDGNLIGNINIKE